jgi:hypothetical protein
MAYERLRSEKASLDSRGENGRIVALKPAPVDCQSILLRAIEAAENDPGELRRLVYALARKTLMDESEQSGSALTSRQVRESVLALETAIARVETDLSRGAPADMRLPRPDSDDGPLADTSAQDGIVDGKPRHSANRAASADGPASNRLAGANVPRSPIEPRNQVVLRPQSTGLQRAGPSAPPAERTAVEIVYPERDNVVRVRRRAWLWFIVWPLIQVIGPAIFCLFLYLTLAGRLDSVQSAQSRQSIAADARPTLGFPLPTTYGIYAVSNGHLNELQPLAIRAPDPRVQLSAEINKPSASVLPDGKVVFVLFRRELVNSAPQKVTVRVVARVARTVTVTSGKTAAAKLDGTWRIRSNSYDLQVSPLAENREMVVVRPGDPGFALSSGRYALVFAGLAYDFTVDGPITAAAQCLESFEAVSGPIFTECGPT